MIEFYLEHTPKRTFAGALLWPGWSRAGKTEEQAIEALIAYGPRYKKAIGSLGRDLDLPGDRSGFELVERIPGNATTEFGAPGKVPRFDEQPAEAEEIERLNDLLAACWKALDKVARKASGKELKKGPRGGGRDLEAILAHVIEAEKSYLAAMGGRFRGPPDENFDTQTKRLRQEVAETLRSRAAGGLRDSAEKRRVLWPPRYFVRRAAWHALDHSWEIEDRIV